MMFDLAATTDMTRTLQAREEKRGREETFVAERPSRAFEETVFLVYRTDVPSMRRNGTLTPTGAELASLVESTPHAPLKAMSKEDAVDRARDARVALLVRKFEGQSTVEDDARLAILTERLRKLSPRVTSADIDNATTMVGELEQVSANLDAIRSKFGLK